MAYNNGDVASAATSVIFEMDLNKDGNWLRFCLDSLSESLNLSTAEWTNICNNGLSSTAVMGSAPSWSFEAHVYYNSSIADLMKKRFDSGYTTLQGVPIRITNLLLDEQLTFIGVVSDLSVTLSGSDLQTISGSVATYNSTVNAKYVEPGTYTNLKVNVLDSNGVGVSGVLVTATDDSSNVFTGVTLGNGQALIPFLEFGTYSLTGSELPDGMTFPETNITLSATSTDTVTVDLVSSSGIVLPGAPTNLQGVAGDGQVSLSWTAPTTPTPTNPISGYIVYVDGVQNATQPTGTGTTFVVTGLSNDTSYSFTVAATSTDGTGSQSTSISVTPTATP